MVPAVIWSGLGGGGPIVDIPLVLLVLLLTLNLLLVMLLPDATLGEEG